jgi:undecaprenyl-phosphate 4-deoxy-4-formamido-L-arabinose transferase
MDDDFQNPVSEVIKLATYAKDQDFDVVYTYYKEKKHSGLRNLGSQFNDRVATVMLKKPRDLYLSSFKIINKFLVSEIIKYTNPFCYIDGLILQITSNIGKIEVMHEERKAGKSGYTFKKLFSLWMNMFTNFSILPLRVAIATGFLFAIVGFLFGIYVIIDKLINPATPLGYTSLMVAIAIFSGVQLIAVGMVGEYLGRLFLANNKKPQYVIRKRFE